MSRVPFLIPFEFPLVVAGVNPICLPASWKGEEHVVLAAGKRRRFVVLLPGAVGFCSDSSFLPLLNCLWLTYPPPLSPQTEEPTRFVALSYDQSVLFHQQKQQCRVFTHLQPSCRPVFPAAALGGEVARSLLMGDGAGWFLCVQRLWRAGGRSVWRQSNAYRGRWGLGYVAHWERQQELGLPWGREVPTHSLGLPAEDDGASSFCCFWRQQPQAGAWGVRAPCL